MTPKPTSELYLLANVELDPDYNFTIDFDNKEAQRTYFENKISNVLDINEGYSFIRENEALKVYADIEDLQGVNYLMYKNKNRWHYAFITRKEYVSESVTRISFKLDVFQTFMFDFEMQESFIDREHQDRYKDGNPVFNTQEENLNYGKKYQLVNQTPVKNNDIIREMGNNESEEWRDGYIVMVTAQKMSGDTMPDNITDGNFIELPCYLYAFPCVDKIRKNYVTNKIIKHTFCPSMNYNIELKSGSKTYTMQDFGRIMQCDEMRNSKLVLAMYYSPKVNQINSITNDSGIPLFTTGNVQELDLTLRGNKIKAPCVRIFGQNGGTFSPVTIDFSMPTGIRHLSIEQLKNKNLETKLFTNPYFYLQLDNQQTEPLTFFNEFLSSYVVDIKYTSVDGVQPKFSYYVDGYLQNAFGEKMIDNTIVDLPLMSDAYLEYIAQNKASATSGMAVAGTQFLGNLAIGGLTGGLGIAVAGSQALNFAGQVANEMLKREDLKQTPDTIKNAGNNGLFTLTSNYEGLNVNIYSITEEYRNKIYNFFFHYGYKANEFKKPNIRSRYYFNYIKVIGANLKTNIDSEYKNELATIFNNGITIWHYRNASTFKGVNNYDYENVEMSLI